jgi:hypothetical protein
LTATRPIALVLDGPPSPAWQASTFAELERSAAVEVVELRLAARKRRSVAQRLQTAVERHIFDPGPDPHAPVDVAPRAPGGSPATLLVWLSERSPPEEDPRDLLWLRHGGVEEPADDAFCRAVLSRASCIISELILRHERTPVVVERTVSGVRPFSKTFSCTLALWKLSAAVPRAVHRLPGLSLPAPAAQQARPLPSTPALLVRAASSWLRALTIRLMFRRPWSIRVRESRAGRTADWDRNDGLVRWRDGSIYADPFLFEHEGRHHLFCEEVSLGAKRGVISHTELRLDGIPADPPKPVLEADCHVSYPFLFAHEGEVFMIPETRAARRIELYRAVSFPHGWRRDAILLGDIEAADATVLAYDGRLWLFASVSAPGASSADELHVFWAEALRGPWHPHACNPVVSDVRCARPAGAIRHWGTRIVRPGQDCSRRYGGAVSFREIEVLTPSAYAEHEIDRLDPANLGGARAAHTYASDGRFEAIDLRRRELRIRRRLERTRPGAFLRLAPAQIARSAPLDGPDQYSYTRTCKPPLPSADGSASE